MLLATVLVAVYAAGFRGEPLARGSAGQQASHAHTAVTIEEPSTAARGSGDRTDVEHVLVNVAAPRGPVVEVLVHREGVPAGEGLPVELLNAQLQATQVLTTNAESIVRFMNPAAGDSIVILREQPQSELSEAVDVDDMDAWSRLRSVLEAERNDPPVYEVVKVPPHGVVSLTLNVQKPGVVIGALTGPYGESLTNTQIVLLFEGSALGSFQRSTLTDSNGAFTFSEVLPGMYRLQPMIDPNAGLRDLNGIPILSHAAPQRTSVTVRPGETSHVVVSIGQGGHELRGHVSDSAGRPVGELTILVYGGPMPSPRGTEDGYVMGTNWNDMVALVSTDSGGNYQVYGITPGNYKIQADPFGSGQNVEPGQARLARWPVPVDVEVQESASLAIAPTIEVVLSQPCKLLGKLLVTPGWAPVSSRGPGASEFTVMARLPDSPFRAARKWYPWNSHVQDDWQFELMIERGVGSESGKLELRIEHGPTRVSKEVLIDMPVEDAYELPLIMFP